MSTHKARPLDDERLLRLADGELPSGEANALRRHLAECSECRAGYAAIGRAVAVYEEFHHGTLKVSDPPPPSAWPDLSPRLQQLGASRPPVRHNLYRAWLAVAAALVIAVGIYYRLQRPPAVLAAELLRKAVAAPASDPARRIRIRARGRSIARRAVYRAGDASPLGPESSEREIESLFLAAGFSWDDPLSARSFAAWRANLQEKIDRVDVTPPAGDATGLYEIHTSTNSGPLTEAILSLRSDNLQPLRETLRVGADLVLVELDEAPASVPAQILPRPQPRTANPAPAITATATPAGELAVIAALHRIGADLGEPVEVARDGGTLVVRGTGLTALRQKQVREAVAPLHGGVAVTFDESASRPLDVNERTRIQVPSGIRSELESRLGNEGLDRALDASEAVMARAFALRALSRRFPPEAEAQLTGEQRGTLASIRGEHASALASRLHDLESALAPVLPLSPPLTISPPLSWQAGSNRLFAAAQHVDELLSEIFAGAGVFSARVPDLATALRQLDAEVRADTVRQQ